VIASRALAAERKIFGKVSNCLWSSACDPVNQIASSPRSSQRDVCGHDAP